MFVLVDDVGWSDVNYTSGGASSLPTPHLDQLAAGGVRLSSHYTHPTCTPTRGDIASRLISQSMRSKQNTPSRRYFAIQSP